MKSGPGRAIYQSEAPKAGQRNRGTVETFHVPEKEKQDSWRRRLQPKHGLIIMTRPL